MDYRLSTHIPVLLHEVIDALALKPGAHVLDATAGGGGHSSALCEQIGADGTLIAMDVDQEALARTERRLESCDAKVHLINRNFKDMDQAVREVGLKRLDAIVLDLGFSSDQMEAGNRGLSFMKNEPLLMTLGDANDAPFTARDVVNTWGEEALANVLYGYGEERYARRIAKRIVEARVSAPIQTTGDLVAIIEEAVPQTYTRGKIHPATRTFQALRIVVNDELQALEEALGKAVHLLKSGGRLAVISFHSVEDRVVKQTLRRFAQEERGLVHTKKPITPSAEEVSENPRARSAKMRVFGKHE